MTQDEEMTQDNGDLEISPVDMKQTMSIAAAMVVATVNLFLREDDDDDQREKIIWACLSVFLHQLVMPSKRPEMVIGILNALIEALREKHKIAADAAASPLLVDNNKDEITFSFDGKQLRGWSYANDAERRLKMQMAHEFAEGWFQVIREP